MYTPRHFELAPEHVATLLATATTAQLVTAHADGPVATLLPVAHRPDTDGGPGSLIFHLTRVNPQWHAPRLGDALAILSGPDGLIDPDWYEGDPSAQVPTWNYVTVHAYGPLVVHDDAAWTHHAVATLSEAHGFDMAGLDAGARDRMLRAIVGVELPIARVEAKAKLSQNRSPGDVAGAIAGLRAEGSDDLAARMQDLALPHAVARYALIDDVRERRRPAPA